MIEPEQGTPQTIVAGMGEMKVIDCSSGAQALLKVTVGSCVALFLANTKSGLYGLAHIMLPEKLKDDDAIGKYADTAVPELIRRITISGGTESTDAYIVGGACMFSSQHSSFIADVGKRNVEAVLGIAKNLKIPVVYNDTGGNQGRTATFNCIDSSISVRTLQKMESLSGRGNLE